MDYKEKSFEELKEAVGKISLYLEVSKVGMNFDFEVSMLPDASVIGTYQLDGIHLNIDISNQVPATYYLYDEPFHAFEDNKKREVTLQEIIYLLTDQVEEQIKEQYKKE